MFKKEKKKSIDILTLLLLSMWVPRSLHPESTKETDRKIRKQ